MARSLAHTTNPSLSISVVIPAYNAGPYLAATLQSILDQGAEGVEVVLADGGSGDDTVEVAGRFADLSLKVFSKPDKGQLDALQSGLRRATGDIVLWLNADDIVMPGAFAAVRETFARHNPDFVYSDDVAFNEERRGFFYGPSIRGLKDYDHFLFYRQMYSECVYWKRSITRFLPEDAYDLRVYTDYAFFLNLRWGRRGRWIPKRLGAFRIREGQASAAFSARKAQEYARVKSTHRASIGMPATVFAAARILYWPWFTARQRLVPQIKRGLRRVARLVTGDRKRHREATAFFDTYLLPFGSKGPRGYGR